MSRENLRMAKIDLLDATNLSTAQLSAGIVFLLSVTESRPSKFYMFGETFTKWEGGPERQQSYNRS